MYGGSIMEDRIDRYSENNGMSRVSKNTELYKKINDEELDSFTVRSNATVLGNQEPEIDIEKIKKILDTKYNTAPQRKSIRIEPKEEIKIEYEDTKEYDINAVIEKAKVDKNDSYEELRNKKLRDTQYNILNNLKLDDTPDDDGYSEKKQEELMELINTITINEKKKKEEIVSDDELDLLEDLKGDGDTQVYESMAEEPKDMIDNDISILSSEEVTEKEEKKSKKLETIDNSFLTKDLFNKKDFVDDDKIVEDNKYNIWIKVLIVLVIIAFLVGLFLFLKSFLGF